MGPFTEFANGILTGPSSVVMIVEQSGREFRSLSPESQIVAILEVIGDKVQAKYGDRLER